MTGSDPLDRASPGDTTPGTATPSPLGSDEDAPTAAEGTEVEIRTDLAARLSAIPLGGLLQTMRPRQWVKNLFVLAPLVFSKSLGLRGPVLLAVLAFVAFCMLSGVVYIINDIHDVEADRRHSRKRRRPIASGLFPVESATIAAGAIGFFALALGFAVDWRFGLVAVTYLIINGAYSLWLKHVAYVDILIVATGFLLRVVGGALAIDVAISTWLLVCAFLLSLFLIIGKRRHEHRMTAGRAVTRRVLAAYSSVYLEVAAYVVGALTLTAYLAYTLSAHTRAQFDTDLLPASTPFVAFGLWRFLDIVDGTTAESPTDAMLKDPPFVVNLIFATAFIVIAIYFDP